MIYQKKLSKNGSITIPSQVRRENQIEPGEKFVIKEQPSGDILLKRTDAICIFCQGEKGVEAFRGKFVCESCRKELGADGK